MSIRPRLHAAAHDLGGWISKTFMELFHTINETRSFLELLHSLAPTGESLHRSTLRRRTGSSDQSSLEIFHG